MSACDCYEIGKALYKDKQFQSGIVWMIEALDRYKSNKTQVSNVSLFDVIENICYGFFRLNDIKNAMLWENSLLALKRKDSELEDLAPVIRLYQKLFVKDKTILKQNVSKSKKKTPEESLYIYETLCRDEVELADEVLKSLKCSYLTGPDPFLVLAPIKMEHLYLDPDVILFHGVMSDAEITYIIDKAEPKITRNKVSLRRKEKYFLSHVRSSKGTSFHDYSSDTMERITHRVKDMTGMSVEFTEWQAVNYGIGGQYVPHHDVPKMSNVAQGGATVFPDLGLTVFPEKGAALYWNNLHPSGELDLGSLHAACPVLRGSKWILIMWTLFMHIGHEFLKLCTLEYQPADYVRKLPPPKPKSIPF